MDNESFSSITQPDHLSDIMDSESPKWEDVLEHLTPTAKRDVPSSNEFFTSTPEKSHYEDISNNGECYHSYLIIFIIIIFFNEFCSIIS